MPSTRPPSHLGHSLRYFWLTDKHVQSQLPRHVRSCSCSAARPAAAESTSSTLRTSKSPAATLNSTTTDPPAPPADHRELATAQSLFITSNYSPGSPLLLPNGASMFNKLQAFLRAQYPQFGFQEVITPTIYKKALWRTSGHLENYADDMFSVRGRQGSGMRKYAQLSEDEEFGLKPMNCPGHCLLFASEKRSYRDLPIRYADFGALHRDEISGALSGLTRVRRFHQDDGHIFCRPSQISEEIKRSLDFVGMVYKTFDLGPYKLVLSTRPKDHYIGSIEEWNRAEEQLKAALDASGREWAINEGDGAFYGPKIDIILKDSDGKEHQTATIQLDFQLPQRFGLQYTAPAPYLESQGAVTFDTDPELLKTTGVVLPVMIHRAILGSLERFMALLIEHYNGVYPFWLSPRPCLILSVSQEPGVLTYISRLVARLRGDMHLGEDISQPDTVQPITGTQIQVDTDTSARPLGKKVYEAKTKGYAMIIVVGPKDVATKTCQLEVANVREKAKVERFLEKVKRQEGYPFKSSPKFVRKFFEELMQAYL